MLALVIFVFCVVVALGTGVLAGLSDLRGLVIPNVHHLLVAGSFVLAYMAIYFSGSEVMGSLPTHIGAGVGTLVITFVLYSLRLLGGGDSKLMSAYALWVGTQGLLAMLFYMGIAGVVLGLSAILIRKRKPFKNPKEGSWIARLQAGENAVPYGIPIVIGAFVAFFQNGYLDPATLMSFVSGL